MELTDTLQQSSGGKPMRVFISHSTKDANEAAKICAYLESRGKTCWIAPRDITVGMEYGEEIINGIEHSDVFVLVYSSNANGSQHVLREVERAVSKKIPVITYTLDNTPMNKSMEYFLLSTQFLDASKRTPGRLQLLSESIDKLNPEKSAPEKIISPASVKQSWFERNKIPVVLGAIAVGVAAIALALFMNGKKGTSNEPSGTAPAMNINSAAAKAPVREPHAAGSNQQQDSNKISGISVFKEGDYVSFGRYYPSGYSKENNDGEIHWVVTDINGQSGEMTLVSQYILDIMPYDTAESGIFDKDKAGNSYDRNKRDTYSPLQMTEFRGNNDWEASNIRAWLNSSLAYVQYADSAPIDRGSDEYTNGYNSRSGFLHDFREQELSMMQEKEIRTPINALSIETDETGFELQQGLLSELPEMDLTEKTTLDKVFLLSIEQVKEYAEKGIFQPFTKPTASAAASDRSPWLKLFISNGYTNYIWATRTPVSTTSERLITVFTGDASYEFTNYYAAASGFGIRPAIVIKPSDYILKGEGSSANPYLLVSE